MTNGKPDQDAAQGRHRNGRSQGFRKRRHCKDSLGIAIRILMMKDADSDFPEPGQSPEHSGEQQRKTA